MLRLFMKHWTWIIPFLLGYMAGKFMLAWIGPAVTVLGEHQWLMTKAWPIASGIIAVQWLTPQLRRFFHE